MGKIVGGFLETNATNLRPKNCVLDHVPVSISTGSISAPLEIGFGKSSVHAHDLVNLQQLPHQLQQHQRQQQALLQLLPQQQALLQLLPQQLPQQLPQELLQQLPQQQQFHNNYYQNNYHNNSSKSYQKIPLNHSSFQS